MKNRLETRGREQSNRETIVHDKMSRHVAVVESSKLTGAGFQKWK